MCGCAARWIWPSTNKPSLIRSMKGTRKLRWRQCRRCNGRMTTRCKTRRAILKKPNPQLTAAMIQSDWGKIGVKARIASYEVAEYLRRAFKGEHDALLAGKVS